MLIFFYMSQFPLFIGYSKDQVKGDIVYNITCSVMEAIFTVVLIPLGCQLGFHIPIVGIES